MESKSFPFFFSLEIEKLLGLDADAYDGVYLTRSIQVCATGDGPS